MSNSFSVLREYHYEYAEDVQLLTVINISFPYYLGLMKKKAQIYTEP